MSLTCAANHYSPNLNNHYTYFLILGLSLAGPLALSFDKKVAFYKKWKYLFPSMILPAAFYIVWDMWFTHRSVWSFNPDHITGMHVGNLPLEEVLFFFVVPYCCVFIYECIRCYFPQVNDRLMPSGRKVFIILAFICFLAGMLQIDKYYTGYTFLLLSLFMALVYLLPRFFRGFDMVSFLVSYLIVLIPFLIVNGFLTAIPVVLYDDMENLGIRIYTIPFEDMFYGMLLVMMNVAGVERMRNKK